MRESHRNGIVFGVCVPVLGELEAGFQQTPDLDANHQALIAVRRYIRLWAMDEIIGRVYGEIFIELRRRGRAMSQVDIFLAAMCRHMTLTLLTADRDFEALPDVRTENWLIAPTAG